MSQSQLDWIRLIRPLTAADARIKPRALLARQKSAVARESAIEVAPVGALDKDLRFMSEVASIARIGSRLSRKPSRPNVAARRSTGQKNSGYGVVCHASGDNRSKRRSRSSRETLTRWSRFEPLEPRLAFAVPTLATIPDATLLIGAPLHVPLDGFDADIDALTYTVSSSNASITPILHQGNRSMRVHVVHTGDGTAADPSFEGDMVFELFENLAPRTTGHIIELIEDGFYNGIIFHRIAETAPGQHFVIQGGDPTGTGTGGSPLPNFDDEYHPDLQHTSLGLLSMAKSQDDTNDSQFFITGFDTRFLDFNHSVFGRLVEGEDIRQRIAAVPVDANDKPIRPVTMTSVTLFNDTQNRVVMLKTAPGATAGQTATITVMASDGNGGVAQRMFTVTTQADTENNDPFLGPIAPIVTTANVPTTFQLPATDLESSQIFYMDRPDFGQFFGIQDFLLPPVSPNLTYSVNEETGLLTVTPMNGATGVFPIVVGVAQDAGGFDWQFVPVYVSPAPPGLPDLQAISDTGSITTDNTTRLNNANAGSRLQFAVANVLAGAEVTLFAGALEIGRGTVPTGATTITITTNGTAALPNGTHAIRAVQTLNDQLVQVGNLNTTTDLVSDFSTTLTLTVDATEPVITSTAPTTHIPGTAFTYDVESTEENAMGFTYTLLESPTGAIIDAASGVITWTPPQSGTHTFRVRASDAAGNTDEQPFSVLLNSPPELLPIDNVAVQEGQPISFTAIATDNDLPSDTLTFSLVGTVPVGAMIDPATGAFSWTPSAAQTPGTYTITVRVSDVVGLSDTEDFTVTVADPIAPVIAPIADQTATENALFNFTVMADDENLPNDVLTFSLVGVIPAGMTINAQSGAISWTPNEDQGGLVAGVTVRVTDAFGMSDEETFDISVSEANAAPVLAEIADQMVNAGATVMLTAMATDEDRPMQTLTFSLLAGAPAGAAINATTGEFTWTPDSTVGVGPHSITVRVTDTLGGNDEETFQVTVNQAPVIAPIADQMIDEGQAISLTAMATDPNSGDVLMFSLLVGAPEDMTIDPVTGVISWTTDELDGGTTVPVTVRVTDAGGLSSDETFNVTVTEVNAPPILGPIGNRRINAGETLSFNTVVTDTDSPAQTITFSLGAGAPAGAMIDPVSGAFSWTPTTEQGLGPFQITIRVSDALSSDEETITVIVNVAPQINAIADQMINEGSPFSLTVTATDANLPNDTLTYTLSGTVPPGATIDPTTGVFTWTPSEAQGPGTFPVIVRVADLNGLTDDETFDAQVVEVNSPPVLSPIGNQTVAEGAMLMVAVSATDPDLPAQTLQFDFDSDDLPTSAFTFDPATGMLQLMPGEDLGGRTFMATITVTDPTGMSDSETFQIAFTEANELPEIGAIPNQTVNEGETLTVTVTATDADQPAQTITFSLAPGSPSGASINPTTGVFSWTPSESQGPGTVTITVRATDASGGVGTQTMQVTVGEVNEPPVFNPVGPQTARQGATTRFFATATDPDLPANTLTYSLVNPLEGMTINSSTGEVTWNVPLTQPEGPMWLTVRVTDAGGLTDDVTIDMVVQRFDPTALFGTPDGAAATFSPRTADNIAADLTRNLLLPPPEEPVFEPAPIDSTPIAASIDRQQAAVDLEMIEQLEEEAAARRRSSRRVPLDGGAEETKTDERESRPGFANPFDPSDDAITPAAQSTTNPSRHEQSGLTEHDAVIAASDLGADAIAPAQRQSSDTGAHAAVDMISLLWTDWESDDESQMTVEQPSSIGPAVSIAAALALPGIVAEIHRRRKKDSVRLQLT